MSKNKRGRPRKIRILSVKPKTSRFSPRGTRGRPDIVVLDADGVEAVRLSDLEKMKHVDAARLMGISRQTFERGLKKARRDIADAIINGKIISIHNAPEKHDAGGEPG